MPEIALDPALLREWPLPPGGGGKNERGTVVVVAGSPQVPGAAVLAGTAALRAGAGKLQIGTCRSVATHIAVAVPEALVFALDETRAGALEPRASDTIVERGNAADAVLLGPGFAAESDNARLVRAVLRELRVPAIVDAAAMTCLHEAGAAFDALRGRFVITPHAGEMAELIGVSREEVEREQSRCALEAAERFGAIVVLKDSETVIAAPDGALYRHREGEPALGTCGSGDVLAGIIAGLAARGADPLRAAAWGVVLHARAGSELARGSDSVFSRASSRPRSPHCCAGCADSKRVHGPVVETTMRRGRLLRAALLWIVLSVLEVVLVGKIDPQETPVGGVGIVAAGSSDARRAASRTRVGVRPGCGSRCSSSATSFATRSWFRRTAAPAERRGGRRSYADVPFDAGGDDRVGGAPRIGRRRDLDVAERNRHRHRSRRRQAARPSADALGQQTAFEGLAAVNVWYVAAFCLLLCLLPCFVVAVSATASDAIVALEIGSSITVLILLFAEQGMQRQTFFDVSLALAVLALPSTLVFVRMYGRWL